MCGIAGIHRLSNRPFDKMDYFVSRLLMGIEHRGHDATGYVAMNDVGDVQVQKASCRAFYFNQHRARISSDARTVLLHTRYATQGKAAFPENNHPVEVGGIYAVHNGHIWNDAEAMKVISHRRRGAVDSEAIPAIVAAKGWDALPDCLSDLDGDMAVAMIDVSQPGKLMLARANFSPLVWVQTDDLLIWASEKDAIEESWGFALGTPPSDKRYHHAQEGQAIFVDGRAIETRSFEPGLGYTRQTIKTDWSDSSWMKGYKKTADGVYEPVPGMECPTCERVIYHAPDCHMTGYIQNWQRRENWEGEAEIDEEAEGLDATRCDDCFEWFPSKDMEEVWAFGTTKISEYLCPTCFEHFIRAMGGAASDDERTILNPSGSVLELTEQSESTRLASIDR